MKISNSLTPFSSPIAWVWVASKHMLDNSFGISFWRHSDYLVSRKSFEREAHTVFTLEILVVVLLHGSIHRVLRKPATKVLL